MTRWPRSTWGVILLLACVESVGCALRRPDTTPTRMIEPALPGPAAEATATPAVQVRLLDTQARGHIGRPLLHQRPDGELIEDPVWQWSSAPDRYLDTALRLELASSPDVGLVDVAGAPALAVTLLAWQLEAGGEARLVGAVEVRLTGTDRVVHTEVIRESEPVSGELPGNLAVAAGRLLSRLAAEAVKRAAAQQAG